MQLRTFPQCLLKLLIKWKGHDLIRRKTGVQDTGLHLMKDAHSKVIRLPLSDDGSFSKKFEEKIKEQKDSLEDIITEWGGKTTKI